MAKRAKAPPPADSLSPADVATLERLIERGVLVAKPQAGSAKPRRVMAAALAHDGKRIILWLSKNTTELD